LIQPTSDKEWSIKVVPKLTDRTSSGFVTNFGEFDKFLILVIKRIFGIGFMWITVFTALKSCKITEKIAGSVQEFAQGMAAATPIIPVAG
jgi:hypothetical protein